MAELVPYVLKLLSTNWNHISNKAESVTRSFDTDLFRFGSHSPFLYAQTVEIGKHNIRYLLLCGTSSKVGTIDI